MYTMCVCVCWAHVWSCGFSKLPISIQTITIIASATFHFINRWNSSQLWHRMTTIYVVNIWHTCSVTLTFKYKTHQRCMECSFLAVGCIKFLWEFCLVMVYGRNGKGELLSVHFSQHWTSFSKKNRHRWNTLYNIHPDTCIRIYSLHFSF